MRNRSRWLGLVLCATLGLGACGSGASTGDASQVDVDPQALGDVVDATFLVPGPSMRRAMRVLQFSRSLAVRECGGSGVPLEGTANRYDQSRFPDLDLIRARGFTEQAESEVEDRVLDGLDASCEDLTPDLPAYDEWTTLTPAWMDVVTTAESDDRLVALEAPMAGCLTDRTGVEVDPSDPVNSLLREVNRAAADGTSEQGIQQLATAYADCAEPYFSLLRRLLLAQRPALVERHRELVEQYAAEIVGAGYAP